MKAKKIILLFFCAFFLLGSGILAGCSSRFFRTDTSVSQTQLNYLKKHQDEIKDFIKEQNPKVESVQIDWSSATIEEIGNGTPQGGGWILLLSARVNNIKDSDVGVGFPLDDKKGETIPKMSSISEMQPVRILKDGVWTILD